MRHRPAVFAAALCLPALAAAQTSPFVPDALHRDLADEISGDRSFENVRHLTRFHRVSGRDFFAAAEWIRGAAVAAGLEDVRLVKQAARQPGWSCTSGEAWLLEPERTKLAAYGEVAVSIADNSRTTHVTAELVDVVAGDGRAAAPAAQCISLLGSMSDCATLTPLLADERASVRELAEDALWQIWMRAGTRAGVDRLARAIEAIARDDFQYALDQLDALLVDEPDFAEAHHQAGIAAHALGRLDDARGHYLACLRRNPLHFAARTAACPCR